MGSEDLFASLGVFVLPSVFSLILLSVFLYVFFLPFYVVNCYAVSWLNLLVAS